MTELIRDRDLRKRIFAWGLFIAVLIYSLCSLVALQKPFNLDEADFVSVAHNINLLGRPVLYMGEDFYQDHCQLKLYSVEQHLGYGLWHPPLYVNILALWFRIIGETTLGGRMFGLFCALLTLFLCFRIIKEICIYEKIDKEKHFFILSIFSALYFINPLIVQFSLLMDIDNSLLVVMTLLIFYIVIKNYGNDRLRVNFYLGLILGISLLAKLTLAPLILVSIFFFYFLMIGIKKAVKKTFVIVFIGFIFFLAAWIIYASLLSLPLNFFLVYNYGTKILPALKHRLFLSFPLICSTFLFSVVWASPAFLILSITSVGEQLLGFAKRKKFSPVTLLIIFNLVICFVYTIVYPRFSMMKYQLVAYPGFIIIIALFAVKYLKDVTIRELLVSVFAGLVFLLFEHFMVPDSILAAHVFLTKNIKTSMIFFYLLPIIILPLGLSVLFTGAIKSKYLILGFLTALFVYNISLDFKQIAPYTTVHSWNNYGEVGLREVIDYLDKKVGHDGVFICRKDIGYYLKEVNNHQRRKWYSNDNCSNGNCLNYNYRRANDFFLKVIKESDIQYIEWDTQATSTSFIPKSIIDYYSFDKQFGDFIIFTKNRDK